MTIKHSKTSAAGASSDPSKVGGDDWNADHVIDTAGLSFPANASAPAAPAAGNVRVYAQTLADGCSLPAFANADGLTAALQPSLGGRRRIFIGMANPNTSGFQLLGTPSSNNGGTYQVRTIDPTTIYGASRRVGQVSPSSASATVTYLFTSAYAYRGVLAHTGGFRLIFVFGAADASANATARCFYGLTQSSVGSSGAANSLNIIGVAADENDGGNLNVVCNDASGAATKVPLGANFPAHTISTDLYEIIIYCPSNGTTVSVAVTRLNTGDTATVTLNSNLPAASTLLLPQLMRSNGTNAIVSGLDFSYFYMETEL